MNAIEVEALFRTFKNLLAVDNIGLTVETGEIFGFLGHNGEVRQPKFACSPGTFGPPQGERASYEAIILTLNGSGFSLASEEGLKEADSVKVDWKAGSLVSPPYFWYHQHFNTGSTKARYFAMTEGD